MKLEVHNSNHHSKTEPQLQLTCTDNSLKFGHVVLEICELQTDRQTQHIETERHIDITIYCTLPQRSNNNPENNST